MDFLTALLQTVAAFCIFVVGYLILMLSIVICLAIATCLYKGGCLARAYTTRSASLDRGAISQVADNADRSSCRGSGLRNCLNVFRQAQHWIVMRHTHQKTSFQR